MSEKTVEVARAEAAIDHLAYTTERTVKPCRTRRQFSACGCVGRDRRHPRFFGARSPVNPGAS